MLECDRSVVFDPQPATRAVDREEQGLPGLLVNFYRCPIDSSHWADFWPSTSKSQCPTCVREIEPYRSIDA